MLYAVFYITICANIFILLREYLSDIFYIQRFLYPFLIVRMNGFTYPPVDNSIKLECLTINISDCFYIIIVSKSYNPRGSLSQVCNKYISEALGQSFDNCELFFNLFLMGFLFFSFRLFNFLMFFNNIINVLKSCYCFCTILICLTKAILKMMNLSIHKATIISNKFILGLENLFHVFYGNCTADFFSIFRVYNGIDPILKDFF